MTILPRGVAPATEQRIFLPTVTLQFANIVLRFSSASEDVPFSLGSQHLPFRVGDEVAPDIDVRCRLGPVRPSAEDVLFSGRSTWDLRRLPDGSEEILFRYGPNHSIPFWCLTIDPSFREATLVQTDVGHEPVFHVVDSPLVEFLVARLIGLRGGLHLHASTALVGGRAYVFVGHSGAGKSTIAAIAEQAGALVPTDDRTLITIGPGEITAWGTPWMGSLERKSPDSAPVAAVYLLQQSSRNEVAPLEPSSAVKEIFVRAVQPRLSAVEVIRTLGALEQLASRVRVGTLRFTPTREAFDLAVLSARSE